MEISITAVEQTNITIVYDRLHLADLSRDQLRSMVQSNSPQIIDLPPVITAVFPDIGLMCVIDDRRIRCNDAGQKPVGERPLALLARRAADAASDHGVQQAYGLNFSVVGVISEADKASQFLTERFSHSASEIQDRLGATALAAMPRLIFRIPPARYTLTLEPVSERGNSFRANLNVHYPALELPSAEELQSLLTDQYGFFVDSILGGL